MQEKSINAIVIVIVADVLAFVFRDTNKNGSQEHQFFDWKISRRFGVDVYTFLYVKKLKDIEGKIEAYLKELEVNDTEESLINQPDAEELKEKIEQLKERKSEYNRLCENYRARPYVL